MKNTASVFVNIEEDLWLETPYSTEGWKNLFEKLLLCSMKKLEKEGNYSVNILLTNDDAIKIINKKFREVDKSTDVLSFPQYSSEELKNLKGVLLGDVVMSYNTIHDRAMFNSKDFSNVVSHLFVHGVLHNFGFDHDTEQNGHQMECLEKLILEDLGIVSPYHDSQ